MTPIGKRAILIIALVLPAAAQSQRMDPARKSTYHERSAVALDHRRSDVPAPKPNTALHQQLNQVEGQMARGSATKPGNNTAGKAPRAASLPSGRNKPIRAHYQRPRQDTAPRAH